MNNEHMHIIKNFSDMLVKQIDKINKKGDITPDELAKMDKAVDIIKDIQVICAMQEAGYNPEEEMYSSAGYYGRNSRMEYGYPPYSSAGGYSSRRGYSRSEGNYSRADASYKMRSDLEQKLNMTSDEAEREMIMKCLRALDS